MEKGIVFWVVHEIVASYKAKHDLAVFIWALNMMKRNMYRCQVVMGWMVMALYHVSLAKLKLFP